MHHIERITCSNDSLVISGVLQGIVLAPLLFILLIADKSDSVSSKIIAFADDKRVYCQPWLTVIYCNMLTVEYINPSSNKITSHKFVKDLGIVVSSNILFKSHIQ